MCSSSETCRYVQIAWVFDNPATILFSMFMTLWGARTSTVTPIPSPPAFSRAHFWGQGTSCDDNAQLSRSSGRGSARRPRWRTAGTWQTTRRRRCAYTRAGWQAEWWALYGHIGQASEMALLRAGAHPARVRDAGERARGEPGDGPRAAALPGRRAPLPLRAHRHHRSHARAPRTYQPSPAFSLGTISSSPCANMPSASFERADHCYSEVRSRKLTHNSDTSEACRAVARPSTWVKKEGAIENIF